MASNLRTLIATDETTVAELLQSFESADQDLLIIDQNTVVTAPHMELLTDYPRSVTTALVAPTYQGDTRVSQDRIASASSAFHQAEDGNHSFLGVIRLSQNQRSEVIQVMKDIEQKEHKGLAIDLLLVGLTRAAVVVAPASVVGAPYIRSNDQSLRAQTEAVIASLDEHRLRLKLANRANDGFFSVFFLRKISKIFTWIAVKLKMTPNQVTLISFLVGLYSAYCFSKGSFWMILSGAILLQLSIIIDCVDGELARYTRRFSQLGAWLDAITDRVKEYLVFFALAYGAARNGRDLWILAMGMMVFQTFRHLSDYNFARINKVRTSYLAPIDFDQKSDNFLSLEKRKQTRLEYWSRKILQFPIGERWLVISTASVIGGAGFTFTIMPILALISISFVFRTRIVKTLTWPKERVMKSLIDNQLDTVGGKNPNNRFDWLLPSLLRLIEGLFLIWLTLITDINRAHMFIIIFAILFNHYDNLYRALQSEKKPLWLSIAGGFILGRVLAITLTIWLGFSLLPLTIYLSTLFFAISSAQWILSHKTKEG